MIASGYWCTTNDYYSVVCSSASSSTCYYTYEEPTPTPAPSVDRRWDSRHFAALFSPVTPRRIGRERTLGVPVRRMVRQVKR